MYCSYCEDQQKGTGENDGSLYPLRYPVFAAVMKKERTIIAGTAKD